MTSSNYSYSHERQMSPEEAAISARKDTLKSAADYIQAVALYTDPEAFAPVTQAAASVNADMAPQAQAHTSTAAAANVIAFTGQEQLLADARRRATEEAL